MCWINGVNFTYLFKGSYSFPSISQKSDVVISCCFLLERMVHSTFKDVLLRAVAPTSPTQIGAVQNSDWGAFQPDVKLLPKLVSL